MKLSDYFDKIIIISALNSKKTEHTIEKLKELGLYDENIYVQFFIPLNNLKIKFNMNNDIEDRAHDRISLSLAHYTIIKQAYNAGLNNVLVLEDDNYFLNDISKWEEVLNNMPEDWDVMKFTGFKFIDNDKIIPLDDIFIHNNVFRKIYSKFDNRFNWGFGASAVAYNRNAMEVYLKNQEKYFRICDGVYGIFNFENGSTMDVNIYMPIIPLFVPIDDVKKCNCGYYIKYNEEDYI